MVTPAPTGLAPAGTALWAEITGKYRLRPDELVTLEDACATTDMIAALDALWRKEGCPATAKGSMGQLIIHPLIGEIRAQRAARNALWRQLKLPDETGGAETNQNRSAGQARWSAQHGA